MGLPTTPLPSMTELLVDGLWTDFTSRVRDTPRDPGVAITRGRSNEFQRVQPSRLTVTLNNTDGALSNRMPTATYYGKLGRNTQLRHRLRWVYATFTTSVSSAWPTADTGQSWTNVGGSAANFSSSGGFGIQSIASTNVERYSHMAAPGRDYRLRATLAPTVLATGGRIEAQIWARTDGTDQNGYRLVVNLQTDGTVDLILQRRISGTLLSLATLNDSFTYTAGTSIVAELDVRGNRLRGRAWDATGADPTTWGLSATDDTYSDGGDIMVGTFVPTTNSNGTINFRWDDVQVSDFRFWGEVPSWPLTWEPSGADVTAPIEAAGLMRRLGTNARSLRSALTRAMDGISADDFVPIAHWPLEDASGTTRPGNLRDGGSASVSGDVAMASYGGASASDAVPVLNAGGQIAGVFPPFALDQDGDGRSIWQLQFMGVIPSGMSANCTFADINIPDVGGDHAVKLRIQWNNTLKSLDCQPYSSAGVAVGAAGFVDFSTATGHPELFDIPVLYGISVYNPGLGSSSAAVQFAAFLPEATVAPYAFGTGTFFLSGADALVPAPQSWRATANATNAGWVFSHHALYSDTALFSATNQRDNADAIAGFPGELAADRMTRLCREEGIPFELIGDAADTAAMGPQRSAQLLDVLYDCADADMGILHEPRDGFGLAYRTRTSLYNQTGLALDYAASQVFAPFAPVEDDQAIVNDASARRLGGGFARVTTDSGPLSIQDPPNGAGVYEEDRTYNVASDDQLAPIAGWRAHVGSWDEARYPQVHINLAAPAYTSSAALTGQVAAVDLGDYLSVANPPAWLPPDTIELLAQGSQETIRGFEWNITWNCVPAGPYKAFTLDSTTLGRLEGDHELVIGVNSSATSWDVRTVSGPVLVTADADDGMQWMIDGELVTVTDVAPATISFRGVGAASTGSSGSRTPGLPAGAGGGDMIFIFASSRNSGTGTPSDITNWDTVYRDGNIALFARIYDSSGAGFMPTVAFTGGAANEDTIAQSAAFSTLGGFYSTDQMMVYTVGRLNASAQDIITPGVPTNLLPDNLMALYLGWKQDDWTSVATPASWTELQEASSTAGNDAAQVWGYRQFTTKPTAGSLQPTMTVTGGAAAISRGAVILFAADRQIVTVTRSVNGVSKSHSAGAVPRLYPAPHLAL